MREQETEISQRQAPLSVAAGSPILPVEADDELSLADIWRVVFKRKAVILSVAVGVFAAVACYTFLKTPVYESVAKLQIDPSRSSSPALDDLISDKLGTGNSDARVQTEVKILQSDTVAAQAIKSLSLATNPQFAGKEAGEAKLTDPSQMEPKNRQTLLARFQKSLSVQVVPNTQLVEVRFRSTDPQLATKVVNAVLDGYMERTFQTRFDGAQQVSGWLSRQTSDLKAAAEKAQERLAEFQKEHGILGSDENDNIITDRLRQLNQQLTEAEADRIVKEARYRLAASGNPELIASAVPSTTIQVLRTQEADLKAQLAQLDSKYGAGYPKVAELQAQLNRLDKAISSEVRNIEQRLKDEYQAASDTEGMLRRQFDGQKDRAYKLNESAAQYAILKHEVEASSTLYDTLQLKLKQAGVVAGLSSSYISVVDRADIPVKPVEPKKTLNLALGLVGGLFGGLLLAFVMESLDDTLRTTEDVETVAKLPAMGAIPVAGPRRRISARSQKALENAEPLSAAPIALLAPRSQQAEAFRAVTSSLLLSSIDEPPKVVVVTSALPGEGKSTVSANLAVALAQRGERVLLVDADLRRSSIHEKFGKGSQPSGLSTLLANGGAGADVHILPEDLPNLTVIPAGPHPPAPAEILASHRMRELVNQWRDEFDRVIIDTPPVLPVSDAFPIAAAADGVIMVIRSGVSRRKAIQRASDLLRRSRANILGAVMNAVDVQLEYYYAYPTRYGYRSKYAHNYYEGEQS